VIQYATDGIILREAMHDEMLKRWDGKGVYNLVQFYDVGMQL
jgi:hypothetical protein